MTQSRDELVARLVRAGELAVSGENQQEADTYFNISEFRFHGPDGFETDYEGLTDYFRAYRAAFDDRSIQRGVIIAEGKHIACQTWIERTFVREFTMSPVGPLPPNGRRVVSDLINIFRFDDEGRLIEEWVRADYKSFLAQLEAPERQTGTELSGSGGRTDTFVRGSGAASPGTSAEYPQHALPAPDVQQDAQCRVLVPSPPKPLPTKSASPC